MKNKQLEGTHSCILGTIVFKHYKVLEKLGTGAFGEIYRVEHQGQSGNCFAVKVQPISSRQPQLLFEAKLYKYLQSDGETEGFPVIYASGIENGHNMMMMDLLGKSLDELFIAHNKRFSLRTTIKIGIEALNRIEFLHSKGFIHRDIKPQNLLIGTGDNSNIIYLIDMGLSKKYICKQKGHILYRQGKQLTGTARYASIRTHKGSEQSRRDDIQSLSYILIYFLKGTLPWMNMKAATIIAKYQLIKNKKILTSIDQLCLNLPSQFASFVSYARGLKFDEKPDYCMLRCLLNAALEKAESGIDGREGFDWENQSTGKKEETQMQQGKERVRG